VGHPQTWNRYAYVNNNPTTYKDPSGLVSPINGPDFNRMLDAYAGEGGGFACQQDGVNQSCNTVFSVTLLRTRMN
jgi:hypothetical protein